MEPILPPSLVPRAKITVSSVQPELFSMSRAVEPDEYALRPPVLGAVVAVAVAPVLVVLVALVVVVGVVPVAVGVEEKQG